MSEKKSIVLIVDDSASILAVLSHILLPHYTVKAATNGEKALKIAQTSPQPELILLDVVMPGLSGFQVCEALRSSDLTRMIPVIFLTGSVTDEDVQQANRLGALGIYTKPVNPQQILDAVAKAVPAQP